MNSTQQSDKMLETTFALLRWVFLAASAWMYYGYYHSAATDGLFLTAFCLSAAYMVVTQYVLFKKDMNRSMYYYITRAGILFDLCALIILLILTGYAGSPMFPIGYLIILHASVYWGLKGAVMTSITIIGGYAAIIAAKGLVLPQREVPFVVMNFIYLLLIGWLGGMIVARERKHLGEKNAFESMAKRDYLTGLWNHRTFQEQLKEHAGQSRPLTVVMADIDKFKTINDSYGHLIGDTVIRELAAELERCFYGENVSVYRYGGEEFAIILPTSDMQSAHACLETFRKSLSAITFQAEDKTSFGVTMSFGAAVRKDQAVPDLLKEADFALYEAKRAGRDRVVWATNSLE